MTDVYAGIAACGCTRAAVVISPDRKADVRRAVSKMIDADLLVTPVSADFVRKTTWSCESCEPHLHQTSLL